MNSDLRFILMVIGIGVLIGTPLALLVIKFRRDWCNAWARYIFGRKWWLFLAGVVMFTALGSHSLQQDKPYSASFFFFFGCLNLLSLIIYGFRTLPAASSFTQSDGSMDLTEGQKKDGEQAAP